MDREKETKEIAEIIEAARIKAKGYLGSMNEGPGMWHAKELVSAGYGNVKRGVKEFIDKLKERADAISIYNGHFIYTIKDTTIDSIMQELYGENSEN